MRCSRSPLLPRRGIVARTSWALPSVGPFSAKTFGNLPPTWGPARTTSANDLGMKLDHRQRLRLGVLAYLLTVASVVSLGIEVFRPGHHVHQGGLHHHHFFTGPHAHEVGEASHHHGDQSADHSVDPSDDPLQEGPERSSDPALIDGFQLDLPSDAIPSWGFGGIVAEAAPPWGTPALTRPPDLSTGGPRAPPTTSHAPFAA